MITRIKCVIDDVFDVLYNNTLHVAMTKSALEDYIVLLRCNNPEEDVIALANRCDKATKAVFDRKLKDVENIVKQIYPHSLSV